VTGPTGQLGRPAIRALERDRRVARIVGMARRPFEPASMGWRKTEYRQGDVADRTAVEGLVADADVVVHLAFLMMGSHAESRRVNLTGSRTVFEAALAARRPARLVFTSSVAAYGYHPDNPLPLTEDTPTRGSPEHSYSAHKAACEAMLAELTVGARLGVYVLRPCVVVGPDATLLASSLPQRWMADRLPAALGRLLAAMPGFDVLPDAGVPFQLVHHDDVAQAVRAAVVGAGPPGAYNLAADGQLTVTELAHAIGWHAVAVPRLVQDVAAALVRATPILPAEAEWVHALRYPMLMDTAKARRLLGWTAAYDARQALDAMLGASLPVGHSQAVHAQSPSLRG
jgi:nucleoside-diphosphate-sugar epimerase